MSIFFLISTIISCIRIISTKSFFSAISPLIIVLAAGVILDLIREIRKFSNDIKINGSSVKVYKAPKFIHIKCSEIKVGNIIKIKNEEIIPADILVIRSSNKDGSFFLQTTNIDGESNLKQRDVLIYTQNFFMNKNIKKTFPNLKKVLDGYIEVEQPNNNIYQINGKAKFEEQDMQFFDFKSTGIRGAKLKNTDFIYGIVLYTGKDTKIMLNINKTTTKVSKLDKLLSYIAFIMLIIRFFYVVILMLLGMHYYKKYIPNYSNNEKKVYYDYLFYYRHYEDDTKNNKSLENLKYFTAHFIISATMIPSSILFNLNLTKILQAIFIEFLELPLRKEKGEEMKCFSTSLQSELGLVKYIFSDKTGTLTKNEMQFKACSVFTSLFDETTIDNNSTKVVTESNTNYFSSTNNFHSTKKFNKSSSSSHFSFNFDKENLLTRLKLRNTPLEIKNLNGCPFNSQGEALEEFLLNIALNHDISIDNNIKNKPLINDNIIYQGASPDEVTLVGAASELGYAYINKEGNILSVFHKNIVKENSEIKKYEILLKIPFSSERQRSTIIIRDLSTNLIKLYIKGSDTKIYEKINEYSIDNIFEITKSHVDDFARRGLRTLCYAYKIIPELEFKKWLNNYNNIRNKILQDKSFEKELDEHLENLENNCFLLGATALEDRLQDNVKEDIQHFIEAGINFWMITGDKMDTAESIGYSTKLFDADTEVYKILGKSENEIIERLEKIKDEIKESQIELSKLTIDDDSNFEYDKNKKNDIDIKVNKIGKIIENNFAKIEEVEEENDNQSISRKENLDKCNFKHKEIDNEDISADNEKTESLGEMEMEDNEINFKKYFYKHNDDNISNVLYNKKEKNNDIDTFNQNNIQEKINEKIDKINKNEIRNNINKIIKLENNNSNKSVGNMSILKFMVDNQYFTNSNVELENFTILKGKVVKPFISVSENSVDNKNNLSSIKSKDESEIKNQLEDKKSNDENKLENPKISSNLSNKLTYNVNTNENSNERLRDSREIFDKHELNSSKNNENIELNKKTIENKKSIRFNLNLPTNSKKFLEFFDVCISKVKEYLLLKQKAFCLFKIPYLYGTVDKEKDPFFEENSKNISENQNNKLKNFLLKTKVKYSLIIHGESLTYCIKEGKASDLFWSLIQHSRSIICCRCSPIQKSQIVKFVKKHTDRITLAIGDGENDVSMIKTAHIGVGIFGKEGYQTASNSDYAFNQFKYLQRLLFVNGRFSLLQNIYFIFSYFYKNVYYCLQSMISSFYNLYSGALFFDSFYDSYFNTFMSIIPLIVYACCDTDFDPDFTKLKPKTKRMMSYLIPDIYAQTRDSRPFNLVKFIVVTALGIVFGLVILFVNTYSIKYMIINIDGHFSSFYELIFNDYMSCLIIHFITVFIDTSFVTYAVFVFFIIQVVADGLFMRIYDSLGVDEALCGILVEVISLNFLLILVATCSIVCVPLYILRRATYFFGTNLTDMINKNQIEKIYIGKYYHKKVDQMIRATRAISKFKKIRKNLINNDNKDNVDNKENKNNKPKFENLIDVNIKKMVEHYQKEKKIKIVK